MLYEVITIHIKRSIPVDKREDLMALIIQLRSRTTGKPGYISGETLKRLDKPDESDDGKTCLWQMRAEPIPASRNKKNRITSYNVCYTKLLRVRSGCFH